jgi:hypothetical protein
VLASLTADSPQLRERFQLLIQHHVAVTSTLIPYAPPAPLQQRVFDAMSPQAQPGYLAQRVERAKHPPDREPVLKEVERERAFVKVGGILLSGPDPTGIGGTLAGFGDQQQIELLVEGGFAPVEAFHIATVNGARFLRRTHRYASTGKDS